MNDLPPPTFLPSGDAAVTIEFGDRIDPALNARVLALDAAIAKAGMAGIVETIPTYRSLLVQFDPLTVDYAVLERNIRTLCATLDTQTQAARRWKIPVVYGGAFGIDLEATAAHHGITPTQLIDKHAAGIYRVYMIGFMPGLAYLGGLDPAIATPRRLDPRLKTPSGTISIGGIQALVASVEMPSGWHLLGRTPVRTWLPGREPEFLLLPGDEVVFEPIDASRWDALDKAAQAGELIAEQVHA
ncbi:MAG: 5-oxoprolinase subunit PxpB [Beijerinckiaceae bacterium]